MSERVKEGKKSEWQVTGGSPFRGVRRGYQD
jgi:hypothetical protein